jgi:hypothetical protein
VGNPFSLPTAPVCRDASRDIVVTQTVDAAPQRAKRAACPRLPTDDAKRANLLGAIGEPLGFLLAVLYVSGHAIRVSHPWVRVQPRHSNWVLSRIRERSGFLESKAGLVLGPDASAPQALTERFKDERSVAGVGRAARLVGQEGLCEQHA